MNCRMEKTREDASRDIADNNKGRGARGQHNERGEQRSKDERGVTRGQQDERGSQGERIKSDGNEGTTRGCNIKKGIKTRYLIL
jgi:hypothetical protein